MFAFNGGYWHITGNRLSFGFSTLNSNDHEIMMWKDETMISNALFYHVEERERDRVVVVVEVVTLEVVEVEVVTLEVVEVEVVTVEVVEVEVVMYMYISIFIA